jgi:tripartite-type tricarboxylate transporter receptor subunit TctC
LKRRTFLRVVTSAATLTAGAAAIPALSGTARAQAYPSRPIRIIVAYPPGGSSDVIARFLGEGMQATLGQAVVLENVGGANGSIGAGRVARARPDGYTLIVGNSNNFVANGALYSLQYDLQRDFAPIALLSETPILIAARKGLPANDLKQLIAWLKANPDKGTDGHAGIGSIGQLVGMLFQKETGTRFQLVPYRGGGPSVLDLVAGQIDLVMNAASDSLPQVRAGTVKSIAVMAEQRLSVLPDTPTTDEAGLLPSFHFSQWFAIWAPKGTPNDVVVTIRRAVMKTLADPTLPPRLAEFGQTIFPSDKQSPEALAALQAADIERWWPIIKAAGLKGD